MPTPATTRVGDDGATEVVEKRNSEPEGDDDDGMSVAESIGSASVEMDDVENNSADEEDEENEESSVKDDASHASSKEGGDEEPVDGNESEKNDDGDNSDNDKEGGDEEPADGNESEKDDAGDNFDNDKAASNSNTSEMVAEDGNESDKNDAKNGSAKASETNEPATDNEKNNAEVELATAADKNDEAEEKEKEQLPPPSWPDVTYDQLIKYPKATLRAHSYFDIQQIRAIKPVTLAAMGISVPNFPELDQDEIIKLATKKGTLTQLYHPTDVLTKKPKAKPFLQKEILRRAILRNMSALGENACHNDIAGFNYQRKKEGSRHGIPTTLPRPGYYSTPDCIKWLLSNPPIAEEYEFILDSVTQWMGQVRDQIDRIEPRTDAIKEALEIFDADQEKAAESREAAKKMEAAKNKETVAPAATTPGAKHNQLVADAFSNYHSQVAPPKPVMTYNTQMMSPPPNMSSYLQASSFATSSLNMHQSQIAAMQMQMAAATGAHNQVQFEINVAKDTFKFNASHFVAYRGFRERLHGHSYRASFKLFGNHQIGRDGYVLDFGCVKSVAKEVCKELNEYFLVPMLSEVLKIEVEEDGDDDESGKTVCGPCDDGVVGPKTKKRKRGKKYPGSVTIVTEDGSTFVFPRQDCLLLPIMHSTAEELAIYIYGKLLGRLDASYLLQRGVTVMEVTVSEAVGQDAVFRRPIPQPGTKNAFDVMNYISSAAIPVMPCATETEAANQRKRNS